MPEIAIESSLKTFTHELYYFTPIECVVSLYINTLGRILGSLSIFIWGM